MRLFIDFPLGKPASLIRPSRKERVAMEICRSLAAGSQEPRPARFALSVLINDPQELDAALALAVASQWVATDGATYEITASGMVAAGRKRAA